MYGQRMAAFVYTMNGWQFANRATYFLLRPTIILLLSLAGIDFIRLLLPSSSASSVISTIAHIFHLKPTGIILDFVQAFVHVVISFTWLLVLLLVVIFASVTMPTSGEAGIAASFQVTPQLMPTGQAAIGPGPTPYLSAALDIGYYLLLIGIFIGGIAVFKKAIILTVTLVVMLIVLSHISSFYYQQVLNLFGL